MRRIFGNATRFPAALLALLLALAPFGVGRASEAEPGDVHSGHVAGVQDYVSKTGDESSAPAGAGLAAQFLTICYHDVVDSGPDEQFDAVTTDRLVQQFNWLQQNGYTPVALSDIVAARAGTKRLPPKPVLLTFDDGYQSFYTRAFPILQAFHYPAVIGLVQAWMQPPPGATVAYGTLKVPRSTFMSWDEVRTVVASGLVEVAAHSAGLHTGLPANPQGNSEPAAVTARYDPATRRYETEAAYERRIAVDARSVADYIERETGHRPRAMIWPYGEYNDYALSVYGAAGMPITFSLAAGTGKIDRLAAIPRMLVVDNPVLGDFVSDVYHADEKRIQRVAHVDLDYIYDPSPAQEGHNLGALVQRIYELGVNVVYLQAFADPNGGGTVRQVYFPNRLLPVRADLFNRVAWQLRTRAHVQVYAWMPVLSWDFGPNGPSPVLAWDPKTKTAGIPSDNYRRLSPFDPRARAMIGEMYEDLARAGPVAGVLFHDDAELSDFEDASLPALAAYRAAGLPGDIETLRADPALRRRWTEFKTDTLIQFTKELANRMRQFREPLKLARNIYARPVIEPESEDWMAQNYDKFLAAYDYTAIEAMPRLENVDPGEADAWLLKLVAAAKARPDGLARTVFELQAVDWNKGATDPGRFVDASTLADQMRRLQRAGALNFGYYPDDFAANRPEEGTLRQAISLQAYEYRP